MMKRYRIIRRIRDDRHTCDAFLRKISADKEMICRNCHHYRRIDGSGYCLLNKRNRETKLL